MAAAVSLADHWDLWLAAQTKSWLCCRIEAAEGELRKLLAQEQQLFTSLESAEEQRQHQLHALDCRRAAAASRSRR